MSEQDRVESQREEKVACFQIRSIRQASIMLVTLLLTFPLACGLGVEEVNELSKLENQRYQAMVHTDLELLDSMLDDGLIFTHASGKIDTKETFIKSLRSGTLTYKTIDLEDVEVRMYSSCGIVTGTSLLDINVKGEDRRLQLRFTTVWFKDQAGWKVVAYQSTHLP